MPLHPQGGDPLKQTPVEASTCRSAVQGRVGPRSQQQKVSPKFSFRIRTQSVALDWLIRGGPHFGLDNEYDPGDLNPRRGWLVILSILKEGEGKLRGTGVSSDLGAGRPGSTGPGPLGLTES